MVKAKRIDPKRAAVLLAGMLNGLPAGSTVSLRRETEEIAPVDGWKRFRATNKYGLEVHPG